MTQKVAMKLEGVSLASMGQKIKLDEKDMYKFLARKPIKKRAAEEKDPDRPKVLQKQLSHISEEQDKQTQSEYDENEQEQSGYHEEQNYSHYQ